MKDREGKAIMRRWPDSTRLFRWRTERRFIKAHPPAPIALLGTLGMKSLTTHSDGAYVNLQIPRAGSPLFIADVFFIEICATSQNFSDKRSRYLASHETRSLRLNRQWFAKEIKWPGRGGVTNVWRALRLEKIPKEVVVAPIRGLRVLYVLPDKLYEGVKTSEISRGYEFFASDTWFRESVPRWPRREPRGGWYSYAHRDAALPPVTEHREHVRKFFDLDYFFAQ